MSPGGGECRVGRAAARWDHHRRRGAESSAIDRHQQTIDVGRQPPSIATHSAAQAAGAGRAPRRSISYACRCPRARPPLSERCHTSPLTELLKPDGCRAPPRSSHRAAGGHDHQRLARAREGREIGQHDPFRLIVQCDQPPRPMRGISETTRSPLSPSRDDIGCRRVAASVVLVAPLRVGTIIAGAAPNLRRSIGTNKPSTSAVSHRPLPHTAPHKLLAQVGHPAGRSRMLVAVHGLALRSASDAIRAPSPNC